MNRVLQGAYREVWVEPVLFNGSVSITTSIRIGSLGELSRVWAKLVVDSQVGGPTVSNPSFSISPNGFLVVDFVVGVGSVTYTLEIQLNHSIQQAQDLGYPGLGQVFGLGGGGSVIPEADFWNETIQPSVAGQLAYWIPLGCYYRNNAQDVQVDIDTGSGWIPQAYGADFGPKIRNTPPPTVADLAIGIRLNDPPPAGWQIRIRWRERKILISPPPLAKVRLTGVGGNPDYTVPWSSNGGTPPNAVTIPARNGFQVEFWRLSRRTGGLNIGHPPSPRRQGRRYVPYFRGAVNLWTFHMNELRSLAGVPYSRLHYRVCYVNPTTGARSDLSPDILVANIKRDERCGKNPGGKLRTDSSVWIDE